MKFFSRAVTLALTVLFLNTFVPGSETQGAVSPESEEKGAKISEQQKEAAEREEPGFALYPPSPAMPIPPASMEFKPASAAKSKPAPAGTVRPAWILTIQNWFRSNTPMSRPVGNRLFQQSVEETPRTDKSKGKTSN